MKAAMYMPGLRPGSMSWTIYRGFAQALRGEGIDLVLLSDGPDAAPHAAEPLPVRSYQGWTDRLAAPLTRVPGLGATAAAMAAWLRAHPEVELLYSEIAYPVATAVHLARRAARWRGAHVVTPMGEDFLVLPEVAYGFRRYLLPRWLVHRTLAAAEGIRFISPLAREHLGRYGDRPTAVVPLNVAPETIAAARLPEQQARQRRRQRREALVRRLGLPADAPILLSLGRLHPFKGLHLLVDALPALPAARLLIVGPSLRVRGFGDYACYLRRRAAERGVQDRVALIGPAPHAEVLEYLGGADVLVVPSLLESMNRVCVEAAAAGTPFVVTRTTGVAGYLTEEGVGLVVQAAAEPIAAAVERILGGAWRRDPAAARRFVAGFDPRPVAARVAALLRRARAR